MRGTHRQTRDIRLREVTHSRPVWKNTFISGKEREEGKEHQDSSRKTRTLKCRGSREKQPCSQVSLDQTQINLYTLAEFVWCGDHRSTDLQGRHLDR